MRTEKRRTRNEKKTEKGKKLRKRGVNEDGKALINQVREIICERELEGSFLSEINISNYWILWEEIF